MKTLTAILLLAPVCVRGQFTLVWSTAGGGGGNSAGGSYSLSGTIAQTEAAEPLTDGKPGGFSLEGGYWTFPDLTEPAPVLNMTLQNGFIVLTWDEPAFPVVLEVSDNLTLWKPVDPPPAGTAWGEPEQRRRFYRLRPQP